MNLTFSGGLRSNPSALRKACFRDADDAQAQGKDFSALFHANTMTQQFSALDSLLQRQCAGDAPENKAAKNLFSDISELFLEPWNIFARNPESQKLSVPEFYKLARLMTIALWWPLSDVKTPDQQAGAFKLLNFLSEMVEAVHQRLSPTEQPHYQTGEAFLTMARQAVQQCIDESKGKRAYGL